MLNFNKTLFNKNEKVLVAVSGGIDSVVLLDLLVRQCRELKLQISVAHFNHLIRGKNAQRDALFVEKLAGKYKIPFFLGLKDVKKYAKDNKMSLEDAARLLRYQFFKKTAQEHNIKKVAVAHNLDDQIETVIMRFLRGSAYTGLSGIPETRKEDNIQIVRPLLQASRKHIEKYAGINKLKNIEDETNKETIFLRNSIRHKLIPVLEKYNKNLKETILRMVGIISAEDEYIREKAFSAFGELLIAESPEFIKLDNKSLKNYPLAIQRRVVRMAIEKLYGYLPTVSLAYIDNFLNNNLSIIYKDKKYKLTCRK